MRKVQISAQNEDVLVPSEQPRDRAGCMVGVEFLSLPLMRHRTDVRAECRRGRLGQFSVSHVS